MSTTKQILQRAIELFERSNVKWARGSDFSTNYDPYTGSENYYFTEEECFKKTAMISAFLDKSKECGMCLRGAIWIAAGQLGASFDAATAAERLVGLWLIRKERVSCSLINATWSWNDDAARDKDEVLGVLRATKDHTNWAELAPDAD